jgi:hypothetical membrane protein
MEQPAEKPDSKWVRIAAVCGMVAPMTFTSAVIIAGAMRPGYDHALEYISALGEHGDASSYIMNFPGFFLFGLLLLAFSYGFFMRIDFKKLNEMSSYIEVLKLMVPVLTVFSGVGYLAAAFWTSATPTLHGVAGFFAAMIWSVPMLTIYVFRENRQWRSFWMVSLGVVICQVIFALIFRVFITDQIGLAQRAGYVPMLVWVELVAIRMYRLA